MEADFLETGALDRPGPIGRVVRGALGAVLAAGFYNIATGYRYGGVAEATDVTVWLGLAFALYYFPHIVNLGFGRRLRHWPRTTALGIIVGAGVVDLAGAGTLFGPSSTLATMTVLAFASGFGGLSFLLAGTLAVPG